MIDYSDNKRALLTIKYVNNTNRHIFLTGRAGTGKTTLLKHLINNTHKQTVVAAPTGIAAINAGGTTLHSLFHLPFGAFLPQSTNTGIETATGISTPTSLLKQLKMNTQKRNLLRSLELLVIDEVSMLRADLLDAIDTILRHIRKNSMSFGGVQLLFIGDLLQLPPVVKNDEYAYLKPFYSNLFFFNSLALKDTPPIYIELEKIFRQTDQAFISVLNNFRDNKATAADFELLNMCYDPSFTSNNSDGYIQLTTHNHKADTLNQKALEKLPGKKFTYKHEVTGDFNENSFPVDTILELKEGAQVMFIKNDYSGEQKFFNGKIGIVKYLNNDHIEIAFSDGTPDAVVEKYTWENKRYRLNEQTQEIEEKVMGTFVHYPIKLAWAITVHKSQGLTFEKAIIDVSQAFAAGQIYVALSRLTSLKGLKLTHPINTDVPEIDYALYKFAEQKKDNTQLENELKKASLDYVANRAIEAFNFDPIFWHLQNHKNSYNKDSKKSAKQRFYDWSLNFNQLFQPINDVSSKFMNQLSNMSKQVSREQLKSIQERIEAAQKYFRPLFDELLSNVDNHINDVSKETGVKKYIEELNEIAGLLMNQLEIIEKTKKMVLAVYENNDLDLKSLNIAKRKPTQNNITEKTERTEKVQTAHVSYELFKQNKTIKEIAQERNLAITTIEGHLAQYVAKGDIDVTSFITAEKLEHIIEVANELDTMKLGPIKEYLGKDYSYSEIKFAVSAYINKRFVK